MSETEYRPVTEIWAACEVQPGAWVWIGGTVKVVAGRRRWPNPDSIDDNVTLWFEGDPHPRYGCAGDAVYVIADHDQPGLRQHIEQSREGGEA